MAAALTRVTFARSRGAADGDDRVAGRPGAGRHLPMWLAAVLVGMLAPVAAACSSSSAGGGTTTSTEPPAGAGATAAVTSAYKTLFDLANPAVAPKVAVVQSGDSLEASFRQTLALPIAKEATGAVVSSVHVEGADVCETTALSAPCAKVSYDILGKTGKPLFSAPIVGWAAYEAGRWVVAKETVCGLFSLASSSTPAGC